jgi:hypothetical protein
VQASGDDGGTCQRPCDPDAPDCPPGTACLSFSGEGVCAPAGTEGNACAPELCDAATICVGDTEDDATCRRRCDAAEDCDEGQDCRELPGIGASACME